jgi:hypothetical protein
MAGASLIAQPAGGGGQGPDLRGFQAFIGEFGAIEGD